MIDQKINQYKDSPFESRKSQRKDIANDGSSIKKSKNDANSELSQSSQKASQKEKMNKMINNISEPYYQPNKNFIKMKTQPNVQPKIVFQNKMSQNPQFTKASRQMTLITKNQIIQENAPTQISNNNVVKNIIPQQNDANETNQINSQISNQNINVADNNNVVQDRVQHKIQNRQKYHEEQIYQINDGPENGKGKVRKIKIEITREQSITNNDTDDFDDGLKYINKKAVPKELNESNLSNVSFSNKNFKINKNKNIKPKKDVNINKEPNASAQNPIKIRESKDKNLDIEAQKEKLRQKNKKLNLYYKQLSKKKNYFWKVYQELLMIIGKIKKD